MPILFTEIGRWWGSNPKTREQVEIDLIARDMDAFLFCECKWTNEPVDYQVLKKLQEKSELFGGQSGKSYFMLFSKSGFTEQVLEKGREKDEVLFVDTAELLENIG